MPQCSVEWHFSHKKTLWIDMLFQHHSAKSVVNSKWQETVIIFILHAYEGGGNPNHKSVWCFSHRSAPASSECISDLFPSHTSFCYLLRTSLGRGNALPFRTLCCCLPLVLLPNVSLMTNRFRGLQHLWRLSRNDWRTWFRWQPTKMSLNVMIIIFPVILSNPCTSNNSDRTCTSTENKAVNCD